MRWLLVGRGPDGVEGAQLEGFVMYRDELRDELGLETVRRDAHTLADADEVIDEATSSLGVDAVLVMPSWREPAARLVEWFAALRARHDAPRLVLLDYYAQTSSPHLAAAEHVDLYVKRQTLRDRALYRAESATGYVFTDHLARDLGWDVGPWRFGSVLPAAHAHKLVSAWSLGVLRRNRRLVQAAAWQPWALRTIDVNGRVGGGEDPGPREWYHRYRRLASDAVQELSRRLTVSHSGRVSRRRYLVELLRSRIVVSPFGWGEVCFRDYEAAACGCLLVKPSMAHVETRPDIFVDHETYAPLRWDLADLEEVVRRALEEPRRTKRIAENGRRRLWDYFERGGFVADIARIADALARRRAAVPVA